MLRIWNSGLSLCADVFNREEQAQMTEPEQKPISDDELIALISQLPASSAAIGTALLRLVTELREIKGKHTSRRRHD